MNKNLIVVIALGAFTFAWSQKSGAGALGPAERDGLVYMREEEKLAHDVYVVLGKQWNLRPFTNISMSETRHMEAVKGLLDSYGVADPAQGKKLGEFQNPDLQRLYTELVARGRASKVEALKVGATIEDLDLFDLARLTKQVKKQNIRRAYDNLARGSRNHLRAFVANLKSVGSTYVPQYITKAEFDRIINSPHERGGGF